MGPNLDLVEKVNRTYEMMMEEDPTQREHMKTGHKNFVFTAVYFLYVGNREEEAARWYKYLAEKYPQATQDKNGNKMSLDEFAIAQMVGDVSETDVNRTTQAIQGLLAKSYDSLALGDDDKSVNYELMAKKIWNRFQSEIKGSEGRIGLPPLEELKKSGSRSGVRSGTSLSPAMQARLRSQLGMPAPTNAPPRVEIKP